MAKLTAKTRNALPGSVFGLPKQRKYPMPDKEHAAIAESYATKEEEDGELSPGGKSKIFRKARAVLTGKSLKSLMAAKV